MGAVFGCLCANNAAAVANYDEKTVAATTGIPTSRVASEVEPCKGHSHTSIERDLFEESLKAAGLPGVDSGLHSGLSNEDIREFDANDDDEGDDVVDTCEGLKDLSFEPHDKDDESEEVVDMYAVLRRMFYEPSEMDLVIVRFGEIYEQHSKDLRWYVYGSDVTLEMFQERLKIRRLEYRENILKFASEYKSIVG